MAPASMVAMAPAAHDLSMTADILGPDFVARRLTLKPDAEGEVVATLVHAATGPRHRRAVLYIHGFVDYFFQTHMAAEWDARGYDVYALDLRKYGRSLLPHQTPNFCRDLTDYDEELDEAARIIRDEHHHETLVVMGHSTGGLVTSLWVARRPGLAQALVLNSPWLDLAGTWFRRVVMTAIVDMVGAVAPMAMVMETLPDAYGRSIHASERGEWDYDLRLKPLAGFPIRAGWMRAIRRGHAKIGQGLAIDCPVLVACSTLSGPPTRWTDLNTRADCVLSVMQFVARAPKLGSDVTVLQIEGGLHDLTLSALPVRTKFFADSFGWLEGRLGA